MRSSDHLFLPEKHGFLLVLSASLKYCMDFACYRSIFLTSIASTKSLIVAMGVPGFPYQSRFLG
nr:MAG TPA: hypothetical protein [Caudoviricetes sp.]